MKIAVVGAGAMGGLFGAAFAGGGADTLLVDVSEPTVSAINRRGIVVRAARGERTVRARATDRPSGEPASDLLVLFVKSYATAAALELAAPLIGPETVVLSLQNGWGHGPRLAEALEGNPVLVGVTYHSATAAGPGVVDHTAIGATYVGPWDGGSEPAATDVVERAFAAAGLELHVEPRVAARIWRKLVLNCSANPTAALTGLCAGALVEDESVSALVDALAREVVAVAQAEGYELDSESARAEVRESLRNAGAATASMRQDVEAGRPTEVDFITGAVVSAAERHAIEVPHNRTMYALIKGYERSAMDLRQP